METKWGLDFSKLLMYEYVFLSEIVKSRQCAIILAVVGSRQFEPRGRGW